MWDELLSCGMKSFQFIVYVILWTHSYHVGSMLSCEVECYHVRSMVLCGGQMLSCGIKCYHVGSNVILWDQCYHVGVKGYHVGSNVIMFCYHVMLSCDVIMGHDNTPPFYFS